MKSWQELEEEKRQQAEKTAIRCLSQLYGDFGESHIAIAYWYQSAEDGNYYMANTLDVKWSGIVEVEKTSTVKAIMDREPFEGEAWTATLWEISPEEEAAIATEISVKKVENEHPQAEKAQTVEAQAAEAAHIEEEKALEVAYATELMTFGTQPLSHTTNRLLHSLAAREQKGCIKIFETRDRHALQSVSTLKETPVPGATWDSEAKEWSFEASPENWAVAKKYLGGYDIKADPIAMGYDRCWECGAWRPLDQVQNCCGA